MARAKASKRRRMRAYAATERRVGKRESYDLVLIVCEGEKTEPNYLNALKSDIGLSNANIKIVDEDHGSDSLSVVNFALEYYATEPIYDRIYCVFDRNGHATYEEALALIDKHPLNAGLGTKDRKLVAINSVPCFEIWLLLHFRYTTKAYTKVGRHSSCDLVIRDLKTHIPSYEKQYKGIYGIVKDRGADAIKHGALLIKHNKAVGDDNPSTRMHQLALYLQDLKPKKE